MIELVNISKSYVTRLGRNTVIDGLSLRVEHGQKLGILGRNGAGKSTLIRLISGGEYPTSGRVRRGMSVSWPLAFDGAFQCSLTGLDNVRFISRIYSKSYPDIVAYVEDFSELGKYLREPFRTYSSGMKARLAFAISMAIDFDCFLIDEVLAVGDQRFQEKCHRALHENRRDKALIVVSHERSLMSTYCDSFAVLRGGKLLRYDDIEEAYRFYEDSLASMSG
jgi:capsular polysaccharide transport system ATP-binding protein